MDRVLITGGMGFLGHRIVHRVAENFPDTQVTIYDKKSSRCHQLQQEYPHFRYVNGDVRDYSRLVSSFKGHDVVIHAAAFKDAIAAERQVIEAVSTNVSGSDNVARAAVETNVGSVVGISSDKACEPANVYGKTKFLMERMFQEADKETDTKFTLIRCGNIVASTYSVIPLFRRQSREGYVTITNRSMTRFWISVDQVVDLVLLALQRVCGGSIVIPRSRSLGILEVALAAAIAEIGEKRARDITYKTIGPRLGERPHELLVSEAELGHTEKLDRGLMLKHAVLRGPFSDPVNEPYSSDNADARFTVPEMVDLILADTNCCYCGF